MAIISTTIGVLKTLTSSLDTISSSQVTMFIDFITTCARDEYGNGYYLRMIHGNIMMSYTSTSVALHYLARRDGKTTNIRAINTTFALISHMYSHDAAIPQFIAPLTHATVYTFFNNALSPDVCKTVFSFLYRPLHVTILHDPPEQPSDHSIARMYSSLSQLGRFVISIVFYSEAYCREGPMLDDFVLQYFQTFSEMPSDADDVLIMQAIKNDNTLDTHKLMQSIDALCDLVLYAKLRRLHTHFNKFGIILNKTIHNAK